jgi:hypothetical protein
LLVGLTCYPFGSAAISPRRSTFKHHSYCHKASPAEPAARISRHIKCGHWPEWLTRTLKFPGADLQRLERHSRMADQGYCKKVGHQGALLYAETEHLYAIFAITATLFSAWVESLVMSAAVTIKMHELGAREAEHAGPASLSSLIADNTKAAGGGYLCYLSGLEIIMTSSMGMPPFPDRQWNREEGE